MFSIIKVAITATWYSNCNDRITYIAVFFEVRNQLTVSQLKFQLVNEFITKTHLQIVCIITGVPTMVPNVTVDDNTININGNIVTLTMSWGEPFNNLDPIVNYTVSCSGDVTCPPNFITTDNITRSYTITNLTSMTNYTFSVVATNSIGSGEAGILMITTPPTPPGDIITTTSIVTTPSSEINTTIGTSSVTTTIIAAAAATTTTTTTTISNMSMRKCINMRNLIKK